MRLLFIIVLLFAGNTAAACDYCNCYLGLDPGYNKNTIGIRNSWRTAEWTSPMATLRTSHASHGSGEEVSGSLLNETFVETELFVKYSPVPKLRLFVTVPYSINTLEFEGEVESRNALSDMVVMAMYQLLNTTAIDSSTVRHRIFAGAGVKFPTGKSEGASDVEMPMSHHLYSGTGSTDYIVSLSYIGKFNKLGWNLDASYKLNGESATDYRYGNTLNVTPGLFLETKLKSLKLLPHIGGAYEMGVEDEYMDVTQEETGGTTIYGSAGVDAYFGNFSLTTEFRLPVYHDMGAMMTEDQFVLFSSLNFHF